MPTHAALEQAWLGRSQGYAAACARKNDRCAPAPTSRRRTPPGTWTASARPSAPQQINYYGFSYGTYLGQVYATLFPERVRRMVLDSNVDPRRVWYDAQPRPGPSPSTATSASASTGSPSTTTSTTSATTAAGRREPLLLRAGRPRRTIPAGRADRAREWTDVFLGAGYYIFGLGGLADTFAGWVHNGDWKPLKALYDEPSGRQRQQLRGLPRRAVHRRPLAAELGQWRARQLARSTRRRRS